MNVEQAIKDFLRHGEREKNLSDRTLRAYESDLTQFRVHMDAADLPNITSDDLEDFVAKLGTEPYRDTSIRRKVAALKVFFRFLEDSGVVTESPARKLKIKQPSEARVPNVLTPKELKALLIAPKRQIDDLAKRQDETPGGRNRYFCAIRDNVIIELLFSTGVRIGELVALDVGDVDLEARRLRITGRGTRGRYIEITLQALLDSLGEYLIMRGERQLDTEALFVGRSGTRLTIYSIENIFKKYVRSAEIKRHVTPHSLRHTMASMLISNGTDIRAVQEVLGHASILSTQVYTKVMPARAKRGSSGMNPKERIMVEPKLTIKKR
jgi:integrase/recombinase XerD